MTQIGIRELKNQASEILRAVRERQREYIVTYRGEPVALLLPLAEEQDEHIEQVSPIEEEKIAKLRPQNRRALALLEEWMSKPVEVDEADWRLFEHDLEHQRLTFSSE